MGDNPACRFVALSSEAYPRFEVTYGAPDDFREPLVIDAEEFIGVKSYKAKGKRVTTLNVAKVTELEPTRFPEPTEEEAEYSEEGNDTPDSGAPTSDEPVQTVDPPSQTEDDLMDDLTGQLKLF